MIETIVSWLDKCVTIPDLRCDPVDPMIISPSIRTYRSPAVEAGHSGMTALLDLPPIQAPLQSISKPRPRKMETFAFPSQFASILPGRASGGAKGGERLKPGR